MFLCNSWPTKCGGQKQNRKAKKHICVPVLKSRFWFPFVFSLLTLIDIRFGGAVGLGAHAVCARIAGLSPRQRAMCRAAPAAVATLGDGIRMGYEECRYQFAGHRWNCSAVGDGDIFGHLMVVASKEAAFTYAITAAGVTYALTAACSRGNISACGCHSSAKSSGPGNRDQLTPNGFKWGGCGADVGYGIRFARRFLDSREIDGDARSLMNLHNNRVGRKIVKSLLRTECKCHGVSGSCALRTCWRALPPFRAVGEALLARYERSRLVLPQLANRNTPEQDKDIQLIIKSYRSKQWGTISKGIPKKSELVYLDPSPNYCERNVTIGSEGTIGRFCNRTSQGYDGCNSLCCGRGYNTHQFERVTQCRCKFVWCCRVQCDSCNERREEYTCK